MFSSYGTTTYFYGLEMYYVRQLTDDGPGVADSAGRAGVGVHRPPLKGAGKYRTPAGGLTIAGGPWLDEGGVGVAVMWVGVDFRQQ